MTTFHLSTLGQLALTDGARSLLPGRRKVLALVAYLARQSPRRLDRDRLASLLWPGVDESRARQSLRTALTELRSVLPDALEVDNDSVRVIAGSIELDATALESDIARGDLSSAEQRWGGEFLHGLEDVGDEEWRFWLESERVRLRTQLGFAFEHLSAVREADGSWDDAIEYADRWSRLSPADERAAIRVVTALRFAGRESDATARYAELSRQLEEVNGAKPSAAFTRLAHHAAREPSAAPGARGLLSPDLVGRDASRAVLTAAWTDVQRGTSRCVLVEAEEGLGKSRLLEEFGRFLRSGTGEKTIVVTRAFASEQRHPWTAVRGILEQLAVAPGLLAAPPAVLATLGTISPAIAERFTLAAAPDKASIADAAVRVVADVAFESPLAILIDDAPAVDPESLLVIERLARRPPAHTLLILTGRTEAWNNIAATDELRQLAHVSRLTLAALSQDETRRLVQSVAPIEPETARALGDRLYAETGGRPGLLQLVLRQLVERGVLAPGPSGRLSLTTNPATLSFPVLSEVGEEMLGRVSALSAESRIVLQAAAVVGPRIEPSLLEHTAGLSAEAYRTGITELIANRLLRISPSSDGTLEFTGEAERRAVYQHVVPSTRRALHRAAARAMRREGTDEHHSRIAAEHRRLGGVDPRRRSIIAAAVVVAALAPLAATLRYLTPAAAMPAGTQILLAGVQNLTPDSSLGTALDLPVRIGLQQSRHIVLIPARQVTDALERMRRTAPATGIDERIAHEIAVRENLPAFLHISISAIDTTYLITGRVIEPEQSRDLFATRVTANGHALILPAMDELLKRLRTALGESRLEVRRPDQSLPRVTTSSLEALRLYSAGRIEWQKLRFRPAKELWLRAVELDSAFAMALSSIGEYYYVHGDRGSDRGEGDRYYDLALAHADRLTERERLALLASAARRRDRPQEFLEKQRLLAERYPDRDTWYNYGSTLMRQHKWREAVEPLQRSVEADSMFTFGWVNLALAYSGLNKLDSTLLAYDRAGHTGELIHRGGNVNQEWGGALLKAGRYADAESIFAIAARMGEREDQGLGMRSQALLAMFQGRYRRAASLLEQSAKTLEQENAAFSGARSRWMLASVLLDLGNVRAARQQLERAGSLLGDLAVDPIFRFYLADLRLRTGDVAGARRTLEGIEKKARPELPADRSALMMLRAELALSEGHVDSAIALAREGNWDGVDGFGNALLADGYLRLGRPDSALAAAKRVEAKWQFGWEAQRLWRHAPLRVARLALATGDTAAARAGLERQLGQWQQADGDFPDLAETRRLLTLLAARR